MAIEEVLKRLKQYTEKYPEALGAALYQKGLQIMDDSERIVPVDQNNLRQTHYVAPPTVSDKEMVVEIGYGTKYAEKVHEMPDTTAWTRAGSGNKYLEKPFNAHQRGCQTWLANKTKENIKLGRGMGSIPASYPKKPKDMGV